MAKPPTKGFVRVEGKDLSESQGLPDPGLRMKLAPGRYDELVVLRTDLLTNIAAEKPVAELRSKVVRDHSLILNRVIGDASSRVNYVRLHKSVGGAPREAVECPQASPRIFDVGREFNIKQNFAQEHPGAELLGDQARVHAHSPEAS